MRRKQWIKKTVSLLVALVMLASMIPAAYAAEETTQAPDLPTATVTELENDDLTFALNFKADEATDEQLEYYGDWYADYVLTVNKDVTFNAESEDADGYLSGQYDAWSENWVNVPFEDVTLEAGESIKVMEYAASLMGQPGLKLTYNDVYSFVKDFDCGVYFTDEFLAANPDLEVTLELRMYNPADEEESYVIGETYKFTLPAMPTATVTELDNEDLTFALNFKADEVTDEQLDYYGSWYADYVLTVNKDVTFNADSEDADGYLSGQYDAWSENWVSVPFEDVTLKAGESIKVMEYAASLMGQSGLKLTYNDVYSFVKDFDCGVYFTDEFLAANPDLEVTLELRMYNPVDESVSYVIGETYKFTLPALPTATVTELDNEDLTFALNFKADEATDEQLAYYGDWYADYVLTVNKDVTFNAESEDSDGYLSGQYDAWSENWVNVPFEDVTLKAGESIKVMEYAASLMGQSGLKLTYNDVYSFVKDFDCGVYFTDEFLAANPDLEVTLELRMYNPVDESVNYVIGETYTFTLPAPDLPTATVTELENEDLTFALNFKADEVSAEQLAYYGDWYADYVLTVNKDVTFNAESVDADGYLSGQYDAWSENWVNVPFEDVTLEAGESIKVMEYAASLMGQPGLKLTYNDVYSFVKDFDCGVFFTPEFLAANPDLEVTLELRMYNPADEEESYVIGKTYVFRAPTVVAAIEDKGYETLDAAFAVAKSGETVRLLKDVNVTSVTVPSGITLNLQGNTIVTKMLFALGTIQDIERNANGEIAAEGQGQIVVAKNQTMFVTNSQFLPIYDANNGAYRFFEYCLLKGEPKQGEDGSVKFQFMPFFYEASAYNYLKQAGNGIITGFKLTWVDGGVEEYRALMSEATLASLIAKNETDTGDPAGNNFELTVYGVMDLDNPTITAQAILTIDQGIGEILGEAQDVTLTGKE